jgi:ankyrin repeat protein
MALTAAAMSVALVGVPLIRVHAIERQAKRSGELLQAIHSDDVIKVHRYLAYGADPNAVTVASPDISGWKELLNPMVGHIPALTVAVSHRNLAVVEALLSAGAKASVRDELGATPLHWLARRRQFGANELGIMKLLIQHGADINARDWRGRTALEFARSGGNKEFVKAMTGR